MTEEEGGRIVQKAVAAQISDDVGDSEELFIQLRHQAFDVAFG